MNTDQDPVLEPWIYFYLVFGLILSGFTSISVGSLVGFHSYLAISGQTTYEMVIKQRGYSSSFTHDQGCLKNLFTFCFAELKYEWLYSFPPTVVYLSPHSTAEEHHTSSSTQESSNLFYVQSVPADEEELELPPM